MAWNIGIVSLAFASACLVVSGVLAVARNDDRYVPFGIVACILTITAFAHFWTAYHEDEIKRHAPHENAATNNSISP